MPALRPYLDLLRQILDHGVEKADRTGTGTLALFGHQLRFDLRQGFPLHDDEEAPLEVDRARADLVSLGEHERRLPARARGDDLGRVGRRAGRAGAGLRPPVARLAGAGRQHDRPDRPAGRRDPGEPRLAPPHRLGVESGRPRPDGAAALPRAVPVLRRARRALLSALPAQRRRLPRRAVQHRFLRAALRHGRPGHRTSRPASSCTPSATSTST